MKNQERQKFIKNILIYYKGYVTVKKALNKAMEINT